MMFKLDALNIVVTEDKVDAGSIITFTRLLHHSNSQTGYCFPSIRTISKATNYSERQTSTHIRKLEDAGYVKVLHGGGPNGCNAYILYAVAGKIASSQAEVLRQNERKPASDKPFKNPKKIPLAVPLKSLGYRANTRFGECSNARKEGAVEKAFLEALGGGTGGYEALFAISDNVLLEAKRSHVEDNVPLDVVVGKFLKTVLGPRGA